MKSPRLNQALAAQVQVLTPTLRPSTMRNYRCAVRRFLAHLHDAFPDLRHLHQLRRDPHLLSWFASMWQPHSPAHAPLSSSTRRQHLVCIRRLLDDLASDCHAVAGDLIRRDDFPPLPHYLPRPLSTADDELLMQQLLCTEGLSALALRLMRATGIRSGECIDLSADCLRQIGPDQWALHVPLGKLHSERLVPVDADVRALLARIGQLRTDLLIHPAEPSPWLLPRTPATSNVWYQNLRRTLQQAARLAGCSAHVQPHQLRHTFASEMLRLGVSLPALMRMLGHKDIRMTLRYAEITQQDMHHQFHLARANAAQPYPVPDLGTSTTTPTGPAAIRAALRSARHLLEMFRRTLGDAKQRRWIQRLDRRLLDVLTQLDRLTEDEN